MHTLDVNTSNVPAFLLKLWKLVEDPSCDDLIAWSDSGISFIIKDQARFASELLPQYFKHNNMASFVRQLNMYGFRKVMNYERSGLKTDSNEMEFQHNFFLKDQSEHLELIKRKIPNTRIMSEPVMMKSNAKDILTDLTSIRDKQEIMDNMLVKMKQENELLWKELTSMRQKHKKQEEIIGKVIHFLVHVIRNPSVGLQRNVPRMLHDSPNSKGNSSQITALELRKNPGLIVANKNASRPVIHEVTDIDPEEDSQDNSNKLFLAIKNSSKIASAKSPLPSVSPLPIVLSPASQSNECCTIDSTSLSSPVDSLNILEPFQTRTSTINEEDLDDESVLGIPLEYITDNDVECSLTSSQNNHVISLPERSAAQNVISIPKNGNVSNVISISECSPIGNVLSIPEGSDIGNIITISDGSNSGNVISIPEGSKISNIISIPVGSNIGSILSIPEPTTVKNIISIPEGSDNNPITQSTNQNAKVCNVSSTSNETTKSERVDAEVSNALTSMKVDDLVIPDLYDTTVCEDDLNCDKISLNTNLSKPGYVDPIMDDSLNTPQILVDDIDLSDLTVQSCKDKDQKDFPPKYSSDVNITHQEHDYLSSTSSASSNMASSTTANIQNLMNALAYRREKRNENVLSNHLLIVQEELNRLQGNIASTDSWNVDADKLLGLFSSDGTISNDDFVDQLRDVITIKKEPEDLENELCLLSPPMLGVELDDLRSPFLEQLDPVIVNSNDLDDELPDTKDGLLAGGSYDHEDLSTVKYSDSSSTNTKRRKSSNSNITKGKRRRVK